MDQQQPQKELQALALLGQAADKYLATLDDIARPLVMQKLQESANIIVEFFGANGVVFPQAPEPLPPEPSATAENSQ